MADITLGIDGRCLRAPVAGTARFVGELGLALQAALNAKEVLVYGRSAMQLPQQSGWVTKGESHPLWRYLPTTLWYRWRAGRLAARDGVTVFLAGANFLPGGWSRVGSRVGSRPGQSVGPSGGLSGGQPLSVLLVHDLVPELYPQTLTWRHRLAYRLWRDSSIKHCDLLVANSHGTAKRIEARYGRTPDLVLHPPVAKHFTPQEPSSIARVRHAYKLPERYLLTVGTIEPRKNLATLIEACAELMAQGTDIGALVIAGARGWLAGPTEAAITQARAKGLKVLVLGVVPDADLPALYAGCALFVLPSIYEGYGMPVAEALCCGAPVLASDMPETREAGGQAALYCEPTLDGLKDGIAQAIAHWPETAYPEPEPEPEREPEPDTWSSDVGQLASLIQARLS